MAFLQSKAEKIMGSREIISVKENDTLEMAYNKMKDRDKNKLVVMDSQNQPKAVVTLTDILGNIDLKQPVSSLQDLARIETVDRSAGIDEISMKIQNNPLLVVTDNNKPIGVLTVSDMQRELGF
jgi:CBS domain-containing protein